MVVSLTLLTSESHFYILGVCQRQSFQVRKMSSEIKVMIWQVPLFGHLSCGLQGVISPCSCWYLCTLGRMLLYVAHLRQWVPLPSGCCPRLRLQAGIKAGSCELRLKSSRKINKRNCFSLLSKKQRERERERDLYIHESFTEDYVWIIRTEWWILSENVIFFFAFIMLTCIFNDALQFRLHHTQATVDCEDFLISPSNVSPVRLLPEVMLENDGSDI